MTDQARMDGKACSRKEVREALTEAYIALCNSTPDNSLRMADCDRHEQAKKKCGDLIGMKPIDRLFP